MTAVLVYLSIICSLPRAAPVDPTYPAYSTDAADALRHEHNLISLSCILNIITHEKSEQAVNLSAAIPKCILHLSPSLRRCGRQVSDMSSLTWDLIIPRSSKLWSRVRLRREISFQRSSLVQMRWWQCQWRMVLQD